MNITDKVVTVAENEQKAIELNKRIGQAVTGSNATLSDNADNIEQLNANLENILYGTDTGGKSYYDMFWDTYQDYGKRTNYRLTFCGVAWTKEIFKPKYLVKPVDKTVNSRNCLQMFGNFMREITDRSNLVDITEEQFDFSDCLTAPNTFSNGNFNLISVDFSNVTRFDNTFSCGDGAGGPYELRIKFSDKLNYVSNAFYYCSDLEKITFVDGTIIAVNGFNFQWSKNLSHDSLVNIINALSITTTGLTVTLSQTAVNKAFETSDGSADGSTSTEWSALVNTKSNWTISLV